MKKIRFAVLLLSALLLSLVMSSAQDKTRVILSKDKSFASQVTAEKTIYEVGFGFDLGGKSLKIPNGSVLKFSGGKLKNGTVDLNDCLIVAESQGFFAKDLTLSGKTASPCYADWFEGSDADKIERAISVFKFVNLSAREYIIDREIVIKGSFALHGASIPDFYGAYGSTPIDYSQTILRGKAENILRITGYYTGKYSVCSFDIENVSFAGDAKRKSNGILITTCGGPSRPCIINNCNFKYLNKAICVDVSKSSLTTGAVMTVSNNNINLCNYALYGTGVSAYIDLSVINNNIEQNMSGGIYLNDDSSERVHGGYCLIQNNNLEGQPFPIFIKSSGYLDIIGNYFESTSQREMVISGTGYTKVLLRACSSNFNKGVSSLKITASYCTMTIRDMKQLDAAGMLNLNHVNLIDSDINFISASSVCLSPEFRHFDSSLMIKGSFTSGLNYVRDNRCCLRIPASGSKIIRNDTSIPAGDYRLMISYELNQTVDSAAGNLAVVVKNGSSSILSTTIPSNSATGRKVAVMDITLKSSASASALAVTVTNRDKSQNMYVYGIGLFAPSAHMPKLADTTSYSFSSRPNLGKEDAGESYFDTSLSKQLYWTGSYWVDATGKKI